MYYDILHFECLFSVNSIMLIVIILNKEQQTPSNILLCSVSVGDIFYIIFDAVFQVSIPYSVRLINVNLISTLNYLAFY